MGKRTLLLAALAALLLVAPASAPAQLRYVRDSGLATVGKVRCPVGERCTVRTKKAVRTRIGRRSFWAKVRAPKRIAGGKRGTFRVKFGGRALAELAGRTTTVKVRVVLRRAGEAVRRKRLRLRLRRAALVAQPGTPGAPGAPTSGPLGSEPPLLARPASAVDVSGVQVTWYPRDSWLDYLVSTTVSNGASGVVGTGSPCPVDPEEPPKERPYTIGFLAKPSWFDQGSGVAALYGQGSVHFRYPEHGISVDASDPEVEINGAASRLILRLAGNGNSAMPSQRVVFATLDLSGQPSRVEGSTYTYGLVRANLTAEAAPAFSTFYTPGTPWGCVGVSFTAPK